MAKLVQILFTDYETGEETKVGRWMVAGPDIDPTSPELMAQVAEMIHDDAIDSEQLAETYCQHH